MHHIHKALQACCLCTTTQNELGDYLDHLVLYHEADTTILRSLAEVIKQYPDELAFLPISRLESTIEPSILLWLRLLKAVLSQDDFVRSDLWSQFLHHRLLQILSGDDDKNVSIAIEVVILLRTQSTTQDLGRRSKYELQLLQSANESIWKSIHTAVTRGTKPNANIYKAWVKWLLASSSMQLDISLLLRESYVQCVKSGLTSRSQEIQKLSLYILRQSNMIVSSTATDPDRAKELSERQVNRYCRAFETIIMGGYALQALECLQALNPDLLLDSMEDTTMNRNGITIDGSWWMLLVTISLETSKSDSTRKNVGNWILKHKFLNLSYEQLFAQFLCEVFLPWAFRAQYYLSTTRRAGDLAICEHGNQVGVFVYCLLSESRDTMARAMYVRVVLQSLRNDCTSGYAYVYVLRSTILYVSENKAIADELDISQDLEDLLMTILKKPWTKSQKLIISHLLETLASHLELAIVDGVMPTRRQKHDETCSKCLAEPTTSLKIMFEKQITRHGFVQACQNIQDMFINHGSDVQELLPTDGGAAFQIIWSESVRQRHPRESLMCLPEMFVADMVMKESRSSTGLRDIIFEAIEQIFDLAQTRIYVWAPLTRRLHRTFVTHKNYAEYNAFLEKLFRKYVRAPPVPSLEDLTNCAMASIIYAPEDSDVPPGMILEDGIGHAYMFDILNRLGGNQTDMAERLFDYCLAPWMKEDNKKRTLVALQASTLLARRLIKADIKSSHVRDSLSTAVKGTKSPRYVFLMEFAIVSTFWHAQENIEVEAMKDFDNFDHDIGNEQLSPKEITSRLKIYVQMANHPLVGESFISCLMTCLPAFCASPRVSIRFEALYTVVKLMDIVEVKQIESIRKNKVYMSLYKLATSLLESRGLTGSRQKELFDASDEQDLRKIFEGDYLQLEDKNELFISAQHFHSIEQQYQQQGIALPPSIMPIGKPTDAPSPPLQSSTVEVSEEATAASLNSTYQSKYFANLNLDIAPITIRRTKEVILVASLIDSPYNLGGLCRAAEIYACSELHIPKLSILQDRAFTSVSVSSESHIRILETASDVLTLFLRAKRNEGFTVVGVEQTDSSLVLGDENTKLPPKAIILVGAEKTGIPADVLVDCDVCVEIKQWGVTRSLNVQTAAATVLYEWRKQHG